MEIRRTWSENKNGKEVEELYFAPVGIYSSPHNKKQEAFNKS